MTAKHQHASSGTTTPTYRSWRAMRKRCLSKAQFGYEYYGGAGVKICERWNDFANFLADMGERPDGTTLDRYPDGSGNYEPGNCRWATKHEQAINRKSTIWIEFNGERRCLSEWARIYNMQKGRVGERIANGWDPVAAITTPVRTHVRKAKA
jgi:hypothetical protein